MLTAGDIISTKLRKAKKFKSFFETEENYNVYENS